MDRRVRPRQTARWRRDQIVTAYEAIVAAGDAGDWNRWADLHTVDCVWNEHNYGIIEGREAIRSKIIELMAAVPMMTFPVEWVAIEGNLASCTTRGRSRPIRRVATRYRFGCVTILEYAGDGQFSYQEDVYNPRGYEEVFNAGQPPAPARTFSDALGIWITVVEATTPVELIGLFKPPTLGRS